MILVGVVIVIVTCFGFIAAIFVDLILELSGELITTTAADKESIRSKVEFSLDGVETNL